MSAHQQAKELRAPSWIDRDGAPTAPVRLGDLGAGWKLVYCFQDWCPGCHSQGFPALQQLVKALPREEIGFAAIQTVFEGEDVNTLDKIAENQNRYGLRIPFGHDPPSQDGGPSSFMIDYHTGGTPWFVLIAPTGKVVFSGFHLKAESLIDNWRSLTGRGLEKS